MAYDNNMTGMLSKNERKAQPNHPDYSGSVEIDGKQYWLSGWIKEGKDGGKMAGKKFVSLAIKPKEAQGHPTQPAPVNAPEVVEDDIGF